MLISRKRNRMTNPPTITINDNVLETVPTFKYLAPKQRKSWAYILYCRYYQHADQQTLRQLYMSIVRPHMEYAAPVWDPHLRKDQDLLESTQKFACKVMPKTWTEAMMSS